MRRTVEGWSARAVMCSDRRTETVGCVGLPEPGGRRSASGGIVCLQVVPLKPQDVSDQHFPFLRGHPDEAGVEAIGPSRKGDGIEPQHLGERCEKAMIGQAKRDREDVVGLIDRGDRHADAAAADIDGFWGELAFRLVGLKLNADGQGDGNAIKFAAIFS